MPFFDSKGADKIRSLMFSSGEGLFVCNDDYNNSYWIGPSYGGADENPSNMTRKEAQYAIKIMAGEFLKGYD